MRVLEAAQVAEVGPEEPHLKVVLAVQRERVPHEHPAHRAERQALDVLVLRQILAHAVRLGDAAR